MKTKIKQYENFAIIVQSLSDLPDPVGGTITLPSNQEMYIFKEDVDLLWLTINFWNNILSGLSLEKWGIINASIVVSERCTVRDMRFENCSGVINWVWVSLDWENINFYNCPNVRDIQNAWSVVRIWCWFINSQNLKISWSIINFILQWSSFNKNTTPNISFIRVESTASVLWRIRIESNSLLTWDVTQSAISFNSLATVGKESINFLNNNFNWPSTNKLIGIQWSDDISLFSSNLWIKNTRKNIEVRVVSETTTAIPAISTYYPVRGTWSVIKNSHFAITSNWTWAIDHMQVQCLSWKSSYNFWWELTVLWSAWDIIALSVKKSTDWGVTFPIEINHIERKIENYSWPTDNAKIPINFIWEMEEWDIVRLEIENYTNTNNVIIWLDSFFIIS